MKTIFVSSTFRDMQYERDAIRELTAPLLNAEAVQYGDAFDFCDQRWGIDTRELDERQGSEKVLNICLDEIDRCQPPMVVLLGCRYGWIPGENLLRTAAQRKNIRLADPKMSVTALEIEYGSLLTPERFQNTLLYFREIAGEVSGDYRSEDACHAQKSEALKRKVG